MNTGWESDLYNLELLGQLSSHGHGDSSLLQRLLVILDWLISRLGKATAVVRVFLQSFSG